MKDLKEQLIAAHTAPDAYEAGKENEVITTVREQLYDTLDHAVTENDEALAHQLLFFANHLHDKAIKAKRKVRAAKALDHPDIQTAVHALQSIQKHLDESRESYEQQALRQIKQARDIIEQEPATIPVGISQVLNNLELLVRGQMAEDNKTAFLRQTAEGALRELS